MKIISLTLITIAHLCLMASFAYGRRGVEQLKGNYVPDLRDLSQRYSVAGRIDDADKVLAELKVIGAEAPDRIPQDQTRQFIANTAWKTPAGTIFEFQANGKGKRSFNGRDETTLVWSIRPGGLVEVKGPAGQGQAVTMWLFRFESKTVGYYGSRENDVTHKLQKLR